MLWNHAATILSFAAISIVATPIVNTRRDVISNALLGRRSDYTNYWYPPSDNSDAGVEWSTHSDIADNAVGRPSSSSDAASVYPPSYLFDSRLTSMTHTRWSNHTSDASHDASDASDASNDTSDMSDHTSDMSDHTSDASDYTDDEPNPTDDPDAAVETWNDDDDEKTPTVLSDPASVNPPSYPYEGRFTGMNYGESCGDDPQGDTTNLPIYADCLQAAEAWNTSRRDGFAFRDGRQMIIRGTCVTVWHPEDRYPSRARALDNYQMYYIFRNLIDDCQAGEWIDTFVSRYAFDTVIYYGTFSVYRVGDEPDGVPPAAEIEAETDSDSDSD